MKIKVDPDDIAEAVHIAVRQSLTDPRAQLHQPGNEMFVCGIVALHALITQNLGMLMRAAGDAVYPKWLLRPDEEYGRFYRLCMNGKEVGEES